MDRPIANFLARVEEHDGYPPLSEAKVASLSRPDRYIAVYEADEVVAVGSIGIHPQSDGSVHAAVETAVEPSMRFQQFEERILKATLALVPRGTRCSVWSRRRSLDAALEATGWQAERTLVEMAVALPLAADGAPLSVRTYTEGDAPALVQINAEAFGDHREAGSLDLDEVEELTNQAWFDPNGLLFHERDGEVAAFCWTKVHPNGDGEIYRIGVGSQHRGMGVGKRIVLAGYDYLARVRSCSVGFLWVDASNEPAMALYTGIGLNPRGQNTEFTRAHAETTQKELSPAGL